MSSNISRYVLYALLLITLIVCGFFYFGGESMESTPAGQFPTPVFTSTLMYWAFALVIIAALATLCFALLTFASKVSYDAKSVLVPVIFVGVLGVILLITYLAADTTPYTIVGLEHPITAGEMSLANMCIVTSVILACIAAFVSFFGFLAKKF
ncbi:MAG: hypothetical protein IK017_09410 [Paludibacteraceae bacterium]|nr:hypothetical protein [Paludibacteraceae bacterium]